MVSKRRIFQITAILLALSTGAKASHAGEPVKIQDSTLLVELLGNAKMIGFPASCPGTSLEEEQSEILCMAELYEAPARVLRRIDGAPTPRRLNIRFTAHSFHAVWDKHVRFLLVVRPFEDKGRRGHFAWYWDWENENGRFCKTAEEVSHYDGLAISRLYRSRKGRLIKRETDDWAEGAFVHCVKGTEKLAEANG
jgi:hypothetical protein